MFAPSRGRELKYHFLSLGYIIAYVRPLAGAGIEIPLLDMVDDVGEFAPSRGRELKFVLEMKGRESILVRPLAGAGIEMARDTARFC